MILPNGRFARVAGDRLQVISKADFIATVVNFYTDSLTNNVIRMVEDVFKAADNLNVDTVMRASKACGPLYVVCVTRGQMSMSLSVRRAVGRIFGI